MTDEAPRRRGRPPKSSYHASAPDYQIRREGDGDEPAGVEAPGEVPPDSEAAQHDENAQEIAVSPPLETDGDGSVGEVAFADGWAGMDTAPDGGRPCVLAGLVGVGIPIATAAYLHQSRRWTGSVTRWVPFTEWRVMNSPERVPFEPMCWTRYE